MNSQGTRARLVWRSGVDVAVAIGTAVVQIAGTEILVRTVGSARPLDPIAYGLLLAGALPLMVRDRYPLPVLGVVAASVAAYTWLGYPGGFYTIALFFAIWSAASAGKRVAAGAIIVALVLEMLMAGFVLSVGHARDPDAPVWFGGWLMVAFVLGEVSRGRHQYLEQVEQRALDAEWTREEEARRRAGEERIRIARELHDVLTHHISAINVQAGVAVHLLDKQPEAVRESEQTASARRALASISESSREAMRELRDILGVLRQVDEAEPRAPTRGLDALDDLVAGAGRSGLQVEILTEGQRRPLPVGTDLAAYRIIQESLTNVARHARARRATISLRYEPEQFEVEVKDDGHGSPVPDKRKTGDGLTGMRERAVAVGGSLEAGPSPEGGFRVRARLPTEASS